MGTPSFEAKKARQNEAERQQRTRDSRTAVDEALSQFAPGSGFFNDVRQDYLQYYRPQVKQQFGRATDQQQFALQRRGLGNSSTGVEQYGRLLEDYNKRLVDIANAAKDFAGNKRQEVEGTRQDLYNLAQGAADPSAAAASASARAAALTAPPAYNQLGDLFARFVNTGAAGVQGYGQAGGFYPQQPNYAQYARPKSNSVRYN
jgi:hypothetical protein